MISLEKDSMGRGISPTKIITLEKAAPQRASSWMNWRESLKKGLEWMTYILKNIRNTLYCMMLITARGFSRSLKMHSILSDGIDGLKEEIDERVGGRPIVL